MTMVRSALELHPDMFSKEEYELGWLEGKFVIILVHRHFELSYRRPLLVRHT